MTVPGRLCSLGALESSLKSDICSTCGMVSSSSPSRGVGAAGGFNTIGGIPGPYLRRRLSEKGTGLFKPCFKPCKSPVPFWDGLSVDKVGNVALGRRRFFLTVVITVAQDAISAGAVLWTMALSATVGVRKKHVAGLLAGLRLVMATGALHHAV